MRIAAGVEMLELQVEAFGHPMTLNPTLIWDAETAILIDTGMPGHLELIRSAMGAAGVSMEQVKAVILTHQDLDHVGSLPEIFLETNGRVEVYAHRFDQPYIEGELPLIKTDVNRMSPEALAALPESLREQFANPPKSKVNHTLEDGQELPFCGGLQVIFTPGHAPGHISLYLKESKTLIAGDAMICAEGILRGPVQQTTLDMDEALQSLKKLASFEIEQVICYHGGLYKGNVNERIAEIAR